MRSGSNPIINLDDHDDLQNEARRRDAKLKWQEGSESVSHTERYECFKAAAELLSQSTLFTLDDLRDLALYICLTGFYSSDFNMRYNCFKRACDIYSRIPMENFETKDWRNMAMYYYNTGRSCFSLKKQLTYLSHSLNAFFHIPEEEVTKEDDKHILLAQNVFKEAHSPVPEKVNWLQEQESKKMKEIKKEQGDKSHKKKNLFAKVATLFSRSSYKKKSDLHDDTETLLPKDERKFK